MSTSYRKILRREFEARRERNPRYSLRAFARDLGFDSSRLSGVLRGTQGLSRASATKLAERLGLKVSARQRFLADFVTPTVRAKISQRISLPVLQRLPGWLPYALRELVKDAAFRAQAAWIAQRLGVTESEAAGAWKGLVAAGLVTKREGQWTVAELARTPDGVPSEAIRAIHRDVLGLAVTAIESLPYTARQGSSTFLRLTPSQLAASAELLRDFRLSLLERLPKAKRGETAKVYALATQLFPVEREPHQPEGDPR